MPARPRRNCDAALGLRRRPEPPVGSRFVTLEAKGYARFMRSIRSIFVGFSASLSLVVLGGFGGGAQASATLFKWVDADGVTHYSDRPAPGAQKVNIASAQTYKGATTASPARRPSATASAPKFTRVEVTRPTEGEAFVNIGGHIDAAAVVEPGLGSGNQLWFVLDGTRQPEPAPSLSMGFDVERGTHTLAVVITDDSGRELVSSAGITFYVRQNSILANPPRGPLLVPPKKH